MGRIQWTLIALFAVVTPAARAEPACAPQVRQALAEVSSKRIEETVTRLVGFGTRHTLSETASEERGIGAARRWVRGQLEEISAGAGGALEVWFDEFELQGGANPRAPEGAVIKNVVAVQRGVGDPDRVYLVGGHLDSRASDAGDATGDAPGANDDATGVACVLEAARILSTRPLQATVVYVAFSGEEQGLLGARHLAERCQELGWQVDGMLNNDMIGNARGSDGLSDSSRVRVFSEGVGMRESRRQAMARQRFGGEVDGHSRQLARFLHGMAELYTPDLAVMLVYRRDRLGRGGDHIPFGEAGYPAIRLCEVHECYQRQHENVRIEGGVAYGDTLDSIDFDYVARVTRLNLAALMTLAQAPPPPTGVRIRGAVQPSTTLTWSADTARGTTGYRVHWRETSAPTWERSRDVPGPESTGVTLENIVVDNYFFGVSSLSAEGYESRVVFPGLDR